MFADSCIEEEELSKRVIIRFTAVGEVVFCPAANEGVFADVCTNMTGNPLIEVGKASEVAALTVPDNIKVTRAQVNKSVAITLKTFFKFLLLYKIIPCCIFLSVISILI